MRVLMIGPDRSVHGGISGVVNNYYEAGLDKKVTLKYIGTMVDGSKFKKLMKAGAAYVQFLLSIGAADILHVNVAADASFYRKKVFIDTAALFHKKIVIHEHGGDFQSFYYEKSGNRKQAVIKKTLNKAAFLVLSEQWQEFFAPIVEPEKIKVLENAIQPNLNLQKRYDNPNILFLGRLCREKGIGELLTVMEELKESVPEARLYLGGCWEDRALQEKAEALSTNVIFKGWVNAEEKKELLKECSMFVLPTYFEGQPVSLLEAMAQGLAVVATRVGGIPQIVTEKQDGILIDAKSEKQLKEALYMLLQNEALRKQYGQAAGKKIEKYYSIYERIDALVSIYEEVYRS